MFLIQEAYLHGGCEVIELRLQLGARAVVEAQIARLFIQLSGLFF